MANIFATRKNATPDGRMRAQVLYYWPLATQILDSSGAPFNATLRSQIPVTFASKLTAAQLAAIGDADALYHVVHFDRTAGESGAALIDRLKLERTTMMPLVEQRHRDRAAQVGEYDPQWLEVDG